MPGVLCTSSNRADGLEATGIFKGVLREDMIDTIRRVGKTFIDVYIENLFFEDSDYPLTYVPMFNMILPLKKDQTVWVYFNQDNHRYPILWKLNDPLDSLYIDNLNFPSDGDFVKFPDVADTKEVYKFSDTLWLVCTESYSVFSQGDKCVLFNGDDIIINANGSILFKSDVSYKVESREDMFLKTSSNFNLESGKKINIQSEDAISMKSTKSSLVEIGNSQGTLLDIFKELCGILQTINTKGSPAAQTAADWAATNVPNFEAYVQRVLS